MLELEKFTDFVTCYLCYLGCVQSELHCHSQHDCCEDLSAGFCGETEDDHKQTLSLVEAVGYHMAYMFKYSMRQKTHAHRNYSDDVAEEVKSKRLEELVDTFRRTTVARYEGQIGKRQLVLIEGKSKRNSLEWMGKNDVGQKVVFPSDLGNLEQTNGLSNSSHKHVLKSLNKGMYVEAVIVGASMASLNGLALNSFSKFPLNNPFVCDNGPLHEVTREVAAYQ